MTFERPPVRYTTAPDGVHLAYVQFGEGEHDIAIPVGQLSSIAMWWENPLFGRLLRRLAHFGRVTAFDHRGTGATERVTAPSTPSEAADDLLAVLDASGVERAALFGFSSAGSIAAQFAADRPERTAALITLAWNPRPVERPGWPYGMAAAEREQIVAALARFDPGPWIRWVLPSFAGDQAVARRSSVALSDALGAGAGDILQNILAIDVRDLLPRIEAPALVLSVEHPDFRGHEMGEHIADVIPDARLVRLPWPDLFPVDPHRVADEVEEFVTGRRPAGPKRRALATVLFTDIVDSTARAAEMGDADWRALLGRHDRVVRDAVDAGRGSVVKATGDGALATFENPTDAVAAASAIHSAVEAMGLQIRAGVHIGEIEIRGDDVGGIAVNIASRVQAMAEPGEILVTRTVKDLTYGSGLEFEDRGTHELKGVPDPWQVLAVVDGPQAGG